MRSRSEHELLLQEAVGYFKSRQGLHRLLLQIKKKFQSLNAFGGTIKLAKLSELEKEHLGLFLNRSFKTQESLTIAVSKIEKQLQETRFAEVELKAILEAYFGEELLGNKIVEQSYHLEREHNITNWLLAQPETSIKKWLSEQFKVDSTWRRWIFQKYRENQQACFDQLTILAKSLNHLVENHFKSPVILTDYPKEIKSFYMKQNEDGKTVRAMDVLFPKIGEIIGGSQREEDYEKLSRRAKEMGVPEKDIWWYMDTRRFGTAPHSGFGLGFERLLLFVTGMTNIRDVIPFPRTPNTAEF